MGVIAVAENCKSMSEINLAECEKVTDKGVIALAENCKSLSMINLAQCQVTDMGIIALAENCKSQSRFHLARCKKMAVTYPCGGIAWPQMASRWHVNLQQ